MRHITHRGVEGTVTELAILWGLTPNCLRKRLSRGWTIAEALET